MPFTLSHAAAVLPFRRSRLPWSALVIGSFGPDFEYFLRMNYGSRAWHFYPDVVVYCLPSTLLIYFAFQIFARRPVLELLPESIHARVRPTQHFPPDSLEDIIALIVALVLGIATHLLWDSLTHAYSWPWAHVGLLRERFQVPYIGPAHGFAIAQGASSAIGLLLLSLSLWRWYRETSPQRSVRGHLAPGTKFVLSFGMMVLAIAGAFWRTIHLMGPRYALRFGSLSRLLLVIAALGCFLWELLAYGVVMTLWHKSKEAHH
jgi:hypothetical protein